MARRSVGLSVLFLGLLALAVGGCEAKNGVAQAAIAASPTQASDAPGKVDPGQGAATAQPAAQAQTAAEKGPAAKPAEAAAAAAPPSDASAALKSAMDQKKYLFVFFYKPGDNKGEEIRKAFAEAEGALSKKALFYAADVSNPKEQVLVSKYQVNRATLPLTLAFADNGAIVKAFPGTTVDRNEIEKSFVSRALAEVQKGFQDKKIMLLCVQGKSTQHNAESLGAAKELIHNGKTANAVTLIEAAPEDPANTDLLKQLRVDATLKEATVFVLVPPGNLAGKVEGATTQGALWQVITRALSSGCGPGGCGAGGCSPRPPAQ